MARRTSSPPPWVRSWSRTDRPRRGVPSLRARRAHAGRPAWPAHRRRGGGTADAADSKSADREVIRVRIPASVPACEHQWSPKADGSGLLRPPESEPRDRCASRRRSPISNRPSRSVSPAHDEPYRLAVRPGRGGHRHESGVTTTGPRDARSKRPGVSRVGGLLEDECPPVDEGDRQLVAGDGVARGVAQSQDVEVRE
jgi:hypothetical protein